MDIATQLDCIENFLTMEVSMIVTFCIDENAMADAAGKVMDSGTAHTIDEGYTFAEDAMTSDPEIFLFMTKVGAQGIGVNNYLKSAGKATDSVAVFVADCDEEGRSMVDASTDSSASVLRGEIGYGTYPREEGVMDLIVRYQEGELEEGYTTGEGIYCYNSFGYVYDER